MSHSGLPGIVLDFSWETYVVTSTTQAPHERTLLDNAPDSKSYHQEPPPPTRYGYIQIQMGMTWGMGGYINMRVVQVNDGGMFLPPGTTGNQIGILSLFHPVTILFKVVPEQRAEKRLVTGNTSKILCEP